MLEEILESKLIQRYAVFEKIEIDVLRHINCVKLRLIQEYGLSEEAATEAVEESYLFEGLQNDPEMIMHDSINSSADDVHKEV